MDSQEIEDFIRDLIRLYPTLFKREVKFEDKELLLQENFPYLLQRIGGQLSVNSFFNLLTVVTKLGILRTYFPNLLEMVIKLPKSYIYSYKDEYEAFNELIELSKAAGWIEEFIILILEIIRDSENWDKSPPRFFYTFMKSINSQKEILFRWLDRIEPMFLSYSYKLSKEKDYDGYNYYHYFELIDSVKETPLFTKHRAIIEKQSLSLLKNIARANTYRIFYLFKLTITKLMEYGFLEKHFLTALNLLDKIPKRHEGWRGALTFHEISLAAQLIKTTKDSNIFVEYYSQIEKKTSELLDTNNYRSNLRLLQALNGTSLFTNLYPIIKQKFDILLGSIEQSDEEKFFQFTELINAVKNTKLVDAFYTRIKNQYIKLLKQAEELCDCSNKLCEKDPHKNDVYKILLKSMRGTKFHILGKISEKMRQFVNMKNQTLITSFFSLTENKSNNKKD